METIEISTSALREFERTYKISPEYIEVWDLNTSYFKHEVDILTAEPEIHDPKYSI
jgi:hypothetical protein